MPQYVCHKCGVKITYPILDQRPLCPCEMEKVGKVEKVGKELDERKKSFKNRAFVEGRKNKGPEDELE